MQILLNSGGEDEDEKKIICDFAGIVRDATVSAGHLDGLAQLIPDGLKFFDQLRIDHLASTPAGALEVLAGEVLAQGRCVAGLIDDDSHVENLLQEKSCF